MGEWTKERDTAARARCDKATPGPWFDTRYQADDAAGPHVETAAGKTVAVCIMGVPEHSDNGPFLALAREDVPDLIAALAKAQAIGEAWKALAQAHERLVSALGEQHDDTRKRMRAAAIRARLSAKDALRALGIDPDAVTP